MRFIKPRRDIHTIFIHCSASDNPKHDDVEVIRSWHVDGNGWSDIGYHFFIQKDGTIQRGRDIEKTPAAQVPYNRGTIAICVHGLKDFTQVQFDGLNDLCHQINTAYHGKERFRGHCEVSAKACPVFVYREVLGLNDDGKLPIRPENSEDLLKGASREDLGFRTLPPPPSQPVLRLGAKGWAVKGLQEQLKALGYHVGAVDSHFGRRTRAALLAFQADNDLITDGVAGELTFEALADAASRPASPTRKATTMVDLAKTGSRIADSSLKNIGAGGGTIATVGAGALGQFSDTFTELKTALEPIAEPFGGLSTLAIIALLAVVGFMTWQAFRAGQARVEDHRSGKTS